MKNNIILLVLLVLLAGCAAPVETVAPISTSVPLEVTSIETPVATLESTDLPATAIKLPIRTPTSTATFPVLRIPNANATVRIGTYDMSIPMYLAMDDTTFYLGKSWVPEIDPRLAFLTNGAVEEIYYTDDAPVHIINDTEYMAVYRKSYVIGDDLSAEINKLAIMYVEKSEIKPELKAATAAEAFLRNRILQQSSSFYPYKLKSERDVYRVDMMYYILSEVRKERICKNGGEYGVVDILVYIPGKGLRKHGLAVFHEADGQEDDDWLYRYNKGLADNGAEARMMKIQFSFANHTDYKQAFNSQDWFNNAIEIGNYFDTSWNDEVGKNAYKHISCFANGYEMFLRTKGDRYAVFLSAQQTNSSAFISSGDSPITNEEREAILDAAGQ